MTKPAHIAVVGGSGAGKSWLAARIVARFSPVAAHVSLDDFYLDLSDIPEKDRAGINFDDPAMIDWDALRNLLDGMLIGEPIALPVYDFTTHTRRSTPRVIKTVPCIVWDGLWLLHHPWLRKFFARTIFIDCGVDERFRRRAERDVRERGRTMESVRHQFFNHVEVMHGQFVEPQRAVAGRVISSPARPDEIEEIFRDVSACLSEAWP